MRFPPRSDTIFAPATGAGRAAIAVVRISGPKASDVLHRLAGDTPQARRAALRTLRDADGRTLDQAIVISFPGPRSETGEDMAELHLHGGRAVMAAVLQALAGMPGMRAAEPGEFAQRALFNGKKSLLDIEALSDLIEADTELQRRQAVECGGSLLRGKVERWRSLLLDVRSDIEAEIDFFDEADVGAHLDSQTERRLLELHTEFTAALEQGRRGEQIREGFKVCLCGAPNAGKSTLLNRIAGRDVAIVSPIAGTTRDRLELRLDLNGVPVVMFDTAGLHASGDALEALGMERARATALDSDLVLWLEASDSPPNRSDIDGPEVWRIASKADLIGSQRVDAMSVSAVTGAGVAELLARIEGAARDRFEGETPLLTRERHRAALTAALASINAAVEVRDVELRAEEIRRAELALDRLLGKIDVEDVLGAIFSRFCIGK